MRKIKNIVYSHDLEKTNFIVDAKQLGINCISAIDTRSAVYMATGICAENREAIIVCVNSSNDSRSAFSGMTEAYYSNLPIVLVTFGTQLDYSQELKDTTCAYFKVSAEDEIYELLDKIRGPVHVEFCCDHVNKNKKECAKVQQFLVPVLTDNNYLYFGQGIKSCDYQYRCKTVFGGMPNCYSGAVANVLGASLSNMKERYIGLISEEEFIHDINSFGNINVNDRLAFVVIMEKENSTIAEFAKSLRFDVDIVSETQLTQNDIDKFVKHKRKNLLFVVKEAR